MPSTNRNSGFTLIEMLVTMAIIAIIAVIAIPTYQTYVTEARVHASLQNAEPLRLALEDYFLDNNQYITGTWVPAGANTLETGDMNWRPDGDRNQYSYTVAVGPTGDIASSYRITVQSIDGSTTVQCDRDRTVGAYNCIVL